MKKQFFTILLLILSITSWAEGGKSQVPLADPYILLDNGKYYAYGTHDASGIRCYSSDDLRIWKDEGQALNKANTTEQQWFWAPEVYHIGDKYIMYYSANEHLFAATATSPTGPFVQVGGYQMEPLVGSEKCIDSSVFFDGDGTAYIFFVRFTDGNCIWQAKLGEDYITPIPGTLRKCFAASQSWELKQGRINEGPNILKIGSRYFLTYSGNHFESQDYGVGYATTNNIANGTWNKYSSNPILRRWDDLVGTGHHSLFYDKEGILRIVFHAHNSTTAVGPRLMYIGTVIANAARLMMSQEPIIRPTVAATAPYSPELITRQWGFERGAAVTVDLNNSGYQDIIAAGVSDQVQNDAQDEQTSKRMTYLALYLPATHRWNKSTTPTPFQVADAPALIPCDINNDGRMDIIAFEQIGNDIQHEAYQGQYGNEGIFLGNGNGTFSTPQIAFYFPDGSTCPFDLRAPCSADILDIDNDGLLDIACAGYQGETSYNVILHNMGEDANGMRFRVEPYEPALRFSNTIIHAADMNNDGYADLILSSRIDDRERQIRFTDIYLNDAQQPGTFSRQQLGEKEGDIKRKSNGALQIADFNNDGWMDIYLSGEGEASSGESITRQRLYLNNQSATPRFSNLFSDISSDIYSINASVNNAAGVMDWNGDGWYDLLVGGIKSGTTGSSGQLYLNDGNGRLRRNVRIPGATGASIIFPDYNGDGRKDFLLNGNATDPLYLTTEQRGKNAILCYNLLPTPTRPEAPTAAQAAVADGAVSLSWEAPQSAQTCFTYEVYIKDEQGNLLNSTPAFVGGEQDGVRKLNRMGRVGCLRSWTFHPRQPGTYTWGVQMVDAQYTGSRFTEGPAFTVTPEDLQTAIHHVTAPTATLRCYTATGQVLDRPHRGINILHDGSQSRKILVR